MGKKAKLAVKKMLDQQKQMNKMHAHAKRLETLAAASKKRKRAAALENASIFVPYSDSAPRFATNASCSCAHAALAQRIAFC